MVYNIGLDNSGTHNKFEGKFKMIILEKNIKLRIF